MPSRKPTDYEKERDLLQIQTTFFFSLMVGMLTLILLFNQMGIYPANEYRIVMAYFYLFLIIAGGIYVLIKLAKWCKKYNIK